MGKRATISLALLAAIAAIAVSRGSIADDPAPASQRKILGRATGDAARRPCVLPNCAIVVAVRHKAPWQPAPPVGAHGIMRNPPFGPYDPHLPVIMQPSASVQERKDVWIVAVRRRDGTVQEFRQGHPALFQAGEEVLIEGDRIRVPD
jgi:hypothetical protein